MVTALLIAFAAITAVQAIYYLGIFGQFAFQKKNNNSSLSSNLPVSVIICAKNEAENLRNNLPKFINQNYDKFEIVLINDASFDDTLDVMEEFAEKHSNIKIVNVENNEAFWGKKKYALTLGIKVTKYDHLVFSDADCYPESENWLCHIATQFGKETALVLGYSPYLKVKNSFLNLIIRFETFLTALQYFSFAKAGMAYMGVGRNLAYTKAEFFKHNGFINHMHVRSGDDDLFVNQAATKNNTAICFHPDSFVYSLPKTKFKQWFKQKRRHVTTAAFYKTKHKALLGLYYITNVAFWVLGIILLTLWKQELLIPIISLIGFRFVLQFLIFGLAAKKFKETQVIWFLPFLEIFLIWIQLCIFITNTISKPKDWK